MILHPTVLANVAAEAMVALMVVPAAAFGARIVRDWDPGSGSERQLVLERRTYLVSTALSYAFALQALSLFLYVFTADALHPLFTGAMCAAGTLNLNAFGYPTLVLKIVNFVLAGLWLLLNHVDNRAPDYPLIRSKYTFLVALVPPLLLEASLLGSYLVDMRADVITSCCGSQFGGAAQASGLGSRLAALPPGVMLWSFYGTVAVTVACGLWAARSARAGYPFAGLSVVTFLVALAALVSVIAPYVYELPTHHCPFCILMEEYGRVGWALYLTLFGALLAGTGVGMLSPLRRIASLRDVVPALRRRLALLSVLLLTAFSAIVTWRIATSNLILLGGAP